MGSILLGKKAGLLAGLLGAGAKVLLEQRAKAAVVPPPPSPRPDAEALHEPLCAPAEHESVKADVAAAPTITVVPPMAEVLSSLDSAEPTVILPSLATPMRPAPAIEAAARQEETETEIQPEPLALSDALASLEAPLITFPEDGPTWALQPIQANVLPPWPVPDAKLPAEPMASAALGKELATDSMFESKPNEADSLPQAAPSEESTLENSPGLPAPITSVGQLLAPILRHENPPASSELDSKLDEALSHKEEFQNYGRQLDFPSPPSSLTEPPQLDDPLPTAPAEAFVNWPESAIDPTQIGQSAFQEFVANMFQEAAQESATSVCPSPALAEPPATVWTVTQLTTAAAETPASEPAVPLSLLDTFSALPAMETESARRETDLEPPELTPEDIWRLASSHGFLQEESAPPQPDSTQPEPSVAPAHIPEPEEIYQLDTTPIQAFSALAEAPPSPLAPARLAEEISATAPSSVPSPPVTLDSPPGMKPFVELFGTTPPASAPEPAPAPVDVVSFAPHKRQPLLTPAEEEALSASPVRIMAVETQAVVEDAAPALHFAPPAPAAAEAPAKNLLKSLVVLTLLAALAGAGYAKRDLLLEKWNQWAHPPAASAAPARSKSVPVPPPPVQVPTAVVTPSAPPPAAPLPTPAIVPPTVVPAPTPAAVEVRPAETAPPEVLNPPPSPPLPPNPPPPEQAGQRKAEDAIRAFLGFTKVEDIIDSSLNRERIAPAMGKYYAANPPTPTSFTDLVLDSTASEKESSAQAFLFRVRTQDRPAGFPVCVEQTSEGYKIEWEAFVQCRDRTAATFWKTSATEPRSLYVILKRSHYFGEDMENLDDYDCFRIKSPNPDEEPVYAFARKDSTFCRKYRNQLTWDANYFAVATFTHVKSGKGTTHQEIVDIERFNWRSGGK